MKIIKKALIPFSWLYGLVIATRNRLYDLGCLRVHRIGVPVVSIGNITTGGTGKTPLVALIASKFISEGKRVAIISRGYRRKSRGPVIVSDGKEVITDAFNGGDEPVELAKKIHGAVVGVDAKRTRIGRIIEERWKPDIIIMDDGFQHRMLHRDCDCVVVDAHAPPDGTEMIPSGFRREPLRSMMRADLIIVTRCDEGIDAGAIKRNLRRYTDAPVVACRYVPASIVDMTGKSMVAPESIRGKKCTAFCGIGSPESFNRTLNGMGISVVSMMTFADHHFYTDDDIRGIIGSARANAADIIMTTAKDAARFTETMIMRIGSDIPLMTVELSARFIEGEEIFWSTLRKVMK